MGLVAPVVVTRRVTRVPVGRWKYRSGVTRYIAISVAVRRALEAAGIPGTHVDVVPSAVPPPAPAEVGTARGPLGLAPHESLLVAVTALTPEKGVETLVETAATLAARGIRCRLVIAGEGPLRRRLEARARALRAPVRFIGQAADPGPLLRAADLMVHAPWTEGLGTAVLDALARGLPIVATRVGGIPEMVTAGVGSLVPPGDVEALADAVVGWLDRPERIEAARRAGPRIAARFSIGRMVEGTMKTYATAVAATACAPEGS